MSGDARKQLEIKRLAAALAERIRWEGETGAVGYRRSSPESRIPAEKSGDREGELAALVAEIGDCRRCGLHRGRNRLVFGEGCANAALVFVGEGPGRDEDSAGRPFVGAAGQLLDRIIGAMGLKREDVYICNVVKCRPPDNRVPAPDEQSACGPFVKRQIQIIGPKVVVTLGATATSYLLGQDEPLGRLKSRFHQLGPLKVMPTYHPAYLLRKPEAKKSVWEDMKLVMKELEIPIPSPRGKQ